MKEAYDALTKNPAKLPIRQPKLLKNKRQTEVAKKYTITNNISSFFIVIFIGLLFNTIKHIAKGGYDAEKKK